MLQSFLLVLMLLTWGSLKRSTIFCRFLIDMVPSRRTYWYLKKVTITISDNSGFGGDDLNCSKTWIGEEIIPKQDYILILLRVFSVIDERRHHQWHWVYLICHFFVLTTFWCHLWSNTDQIYGNMESVC